jgi:hypothetical protein
MWDLTVPGSNDHDFYVAVAATAVLVHNCPAVPRNWQDFYNEDDDAPSQEPMKPPGAGSPNYAENDYADYVANKYGLDDTQQEALHRAITGQNLPSDEIEQIAQDIADGQY